MIFLINVPIGIFPIIMARFIPESHAPERPLLDWGGVVIVSLGLILFLYPLIESPNHGWTILSLAASALVLLGFWRHQERRRMANQQPLVDTMLLRQSRFNMDGSLVLLIYSTSSVFFLTYALLVQTGRFEPACRRKSICTLQHRIYCIFHSSRPSCRTFWNHCYLLGSRILYVLICCINRASMDRRW
ncbi:hypothetical protein SAMN04488123_11048 [Natribacillus halophilus]|uniref:Major Facilitator Superfamily protein n=1 Tax=Natribacillus halophilus TaxID=549003 RepID=A0A1G8Q1B0_9BACI|nr:hypothetical protein SAMN04488123_11048 [Natribacillus halophilus]